MAKAPNPRTTQVEGGRVVTDEMRQAAARNGEHRLNSFAVTVTVDGVEHVFRAGDVTARHATLLRKATDSEKLDPVAYLLLLVDGAKLTTLVPLDVAAQLVYLARLQAGEQVSFDVVADGLRFDSDVRFTFPDGQAPVELPAEGEVAFPDPPASGGSS